MNDFISPETIRILTVVALPVLFAIALHEAAHGYTANYFGDQTAAKEGRLSLNPAHHIDLFGTIVLPLVLYWTIQMPFGYAKPVPVDMTQLRNPKKQMAWVALAGPAANFVMGLGWSVVMLGLGAVGVVEPFFWEMAQAGVAINITLCVFNLLPIPPLDGGHILAALLPARLARLFERIERYRTAMFAALVLLMYFHLLDGVLRGAMHAVAAVYRLLLTPLRLMLG